MRRRVAALASLAILVVAIHGVCKASCSISPSQGMGPWWDPTDLENQLAALEWVECCCYDNCPDGEPVVLDRDDPIPGCLCPSPFSQDWCVYEFVEYRQDWVACSYEGDKNYIDPGTNEIAYDLSNRQHYVNIECLCVYNGVVHRVVCEDFTIFYVADFLCTDC